MANKDAPFGLKPVRMMGGAPYSGGQSRYRIASGATTPIFNGDLVTQLTAGVLGRHAATGTVPIVGVFNGVSYTDPTTGEQVFKNYFLKPNFIQSTSRHVQMHTVDKVDHLTNWYVLDILSHS